MTFGDDESVDFRATRDFQERHDADVNPSNDTFRRFGDEYGVLRSGLQAGETFLHFPGCGGIAKFAAQFREARYIAFSRPADS